MAHTNHLRRDTGVLLMVGTTKGAFLLASDEQRRDWELAGPYFPGRSIYALALDRRNGRRRLLAGTTSSHFGPVVATSDDLGRTFKEPESSGIRFPDGSGLSVEHIWQIVTAGDGDTLHAGIEPAALFTSRDAGESWSLNEGLFTHPHRTQWHPGGGGLCLHTILPLGERLCVAISTGGFYRSDDGGRTWAARNQGIRAPFYPEGQQYPEFGQCVHKVAADPTDPTRLYLQHHWGVYRSDDAGDRWTSVGAGLPSDFGFAVVTHPRDGGCFYVLPIEADMFRATPEAKLRVYRTRDGAATWEGLSEGLPQVDAYECVLRDGMAGDSLAPAGLYFGTRSGKLYGSSDEGDSWQLIKEGLPPIACVKTGLLG